MSAMYKLKYRYIDDNPRGHHDIDSEFTTLEQAKEAAEHYKINASNPIQIKIIKIEYVEEEIEVL